MIVQNVFDLFYPKLGKKYPSQQELGVLSRPTQFNEAENLELNNGGFMLGQLRMMMMMNMIMVVVVVVVIIVIVVVSVAHATFTMVVLKNSI